MMEPMQIEYQKFYYNSLFYDYIFSYEKLKKYFQYDFHDPDAFKKRAEDISGIYNNGFRPKISDRLAHINKRFGCSEITIKNCESLKDRETLVVIGGQQPGLLTGPVFIIYKIFSIIKLARHLSGFLNLKVVPVFWNASDDSNFSQVNNTFLLDRELKKVDLSLTDISQIPDDKNQKRFSDILIPEGLALKKINEFMGFLPETDFKDSLRDFFSGCLKRLSKSHFESSNREHGGQAAAVCRPDHSAVNDTCPTNSISPNDFFSALITGLFSKYGLVLIDPSDTELKKLSLPVLEGDICNHGSIEKLVNKSGERLVKDGYHSQLTADKDFLNFFIVKDGVRKRIKCGRGSSYIFNKTALSEEDLRSLIVSDFSKISLNVISRPLFQDMMLPVLATVCGPGEVSYFSQLKEVYDISGLKQPIIYPRFSATIVENKIKKAVEKTGMGFELLKHERKDISGIIAKNNPGIDIDNILKSLENDILDKTVKVRDFMDKSGIEYGSYFGRLENNLKKEIKILSKKISSEAENKNFSLTLGIDKIFLNLFPSGKLQERVINVFYYINKYDFKFLEDLYDIIDVKNWTHKLVIL
jgi:Uncharacterized protein conserved in bacteria